MNFAIAAVSDATLPILDGILTGWPELPGDVRQAIESAVTEHGPAIADARDGFGAASAVCAFLNALWPVRSSLPQDVRDLLEAGQVGARPTTGTRSISMAMLADDRRAQVLERLVKIADFHQYRDPVGLARRADALLDEHRDRLTAGERGELAALRAAHPRRSEAASAAADYLKAIGKAFGAYPSIARLLDAPDAKTWRSERTTRGVGPIAKSPSLVPPSFSIYGGDISFDPSVSSRGIQYADELEAVPKGVGPTAGAPPPSDDEQVSRYANVHFPDKVLLDQDAVPLIVHVAGRFHAGARGDAEQARMSLALSPLTVVVRPEGFEVTEETIGGLAVADAGPHVRRVEVLRERDCEPLVFFLKPQSAGVKRISVDFEQFDRRLVTIDFKTEVLGDAASLTRLGSVNVPLVAITSPLLGADARPPDLELRIALSADRRTLDYTLHSPGSSSYNFKRVGSKALRDDPLTFLQPIFNRLSDLAKKSATTRTPAETQAADRALTAIGVDLYHQLFSDELKREYNKVLRKKFAGKSLLITTDDPWIPWELVTPQDPAEDGDEPWEMPNDPPLCEKFQLSRWVAGRGAPDQVKLATGAWVAPPDNLQAAQVESDYFAELHRRQWEVSLTGPLQSLSEVTDALNAGRTHLYHFACHGNFDASSADESKLKLGSEFLTPRDVGTYRPGIRRSKPVVFLNACHSGRVGIGLTQLGGWAETFLDCDASAFIGTLWEANDVLAAQFAQEFYDRLWGLGEFAGRSQPLGEAFYGARMKIKAADPTNPTWLAYVLYGDPCGQVLLGG